MAMSNKFPGGRSRAYGIRRCIRLLQVIIFLPLSGFAYPAEAGTSLNYEIDRQDSVLKIFVYRAGLLKAFGHDHLISTTLINGGLLYTMPLSPAAAFKLTVPVDALVVDDPEQRKAAGGRYSDPVPDKDRSGTRRNMLGDKVLDAAHYPDIIISGHWVAGAPSQATVAVSLGLRDKLAKYSVPVAIRVQHDRLLVTGTLHMKQTELGIVPFSVLGGVLQVANGMDVSFSLAFVPVAGSEQPHM
jgi:hypothetical protein